MRIAIFIGVSGILLLLAGAILEEKHWARLVLQSRNPEAVTDFKNDFRNTNDPILRFTLANLPQVRLNPALARAKDRLPVYHTLKREELKLLLDAAEKCEFPSGSIAARSTVIKALIWQRFLCNENESLPANFFRSSPFLHPGGSSYALLAFTSGRSPFASREWLTLHRDALHVLELPILKDYLDLHPLQGLVAGLGEKGARAVLSEEPLVLTTSHALLIEDPGRAVFRSVLPRYEVFARPVWDKALGNSYFDVTEDPKPHQNVITQEGLLSWVLKPSSMKSARSVYRYTAVSGLILAALSLLSMILIQIRTRIRDHDERLFVLQTLTHEIRTPATALNLASESLRDQFDYLNEEGQKALMRLLSATSRLGRVLEASTQYLRTDRHLGQLMLQKSHVESFEEWCEELLEDDIEFTLEDGDFSMDVDTYWLRTALENLFRNARRHGKPPIQFRVSKAVDRVRMCLQDDGDLTKEQAMGLGAPFAKGNQSDGLGLGLVLVKRIAESMDGKLQIYTNPTCFVLEIANVKSSID